MRAKNRSRSRDVRFLITVVGSLLAVGLVAQVTMGQDSDAAHQILIEQATATWEKPLVASTELEAALAQVAPRLRIEHAAVAWPGTSESSQGLEAATAQVEPRIRLVGAATSSLFAIENSPELAGTVASVRPRLLIEHAATSSVLGPLSDGGIAKEVETNDRVLIEHAATSVVESPTPPPGWVASPPPTPSTQPVAAVAPATSAPPSTPAPTAVKPATTPAPAATTPTTTAPPTPAPSTPKPATANTQPTTTKPTTTAARPSAPVRPATADRHSSLWWLWLLCGAAVVALGALGVRAYRRRDKDRPIGDSAAEVRQPATVTAAPRQAARHDRARPNASALSRRSPAAVFLLPFVTFGIYALYWLVRTKTELNAAGAKVPTAILLIVPIANLYWLWKFGEGVDYVTDRRMSTGVAFLLVLFLDIIGSAIIQSQLNQVER